MINSTTGRRIYRWTLAIIWFAIIYLTLPYARLWTDWITDKLSGYFIPLSVIAVFIALLVYSIVRMIRKKSSFSDYILLLIVLAGYVFSLKQIKILIEQVHFIEYGLLSILFFRALSVDKIKTADYLNAILLITLAGLVDEFIQGLLVNRVGELHDVYLNVLAGGLALVWYRYCIKPGEEYPSHWRKALKITIPIISLIILAIATFNSTITDFGHYIEDEEIGAFYSRMPAQDLLHDSPDIEYFKSEVLPRLYEENYAGLLQMINNTVHGEVLVHLFRRDKRLKRDNDFITAYRENQILDKYFINYIENTEYKWSDDKILNVRQAAESELDILYISPVSEQIITAFTEKTQWIVVIVLQLICFAILIYLFNQNKYIEDKR